MIQFADEAVIEVRSGKGGNGCVAFHREKYVAAGGPDGGDGGNGGNIVFRVDEGTNTLLAFRYKRKFVAENGGNGKGAKFHGANGADCVISVPRGTLIKDAETGKIIKDLSVDDEFICIKGGKGGWGGNGADCSAGITQHTPGGNGGDGGDGGDTISGIFYENGITRMLVTDEDCGNGGSKGASGPVLDNGEEEHGRPGQDGEDGNDGKTDNSFVLEFKESF